MALCNRPLASGEVQPDFFSYMPASRPNNKKIFTYTAVWVGKFMPILGGMSCQMVDDENVTEFTYGEYTIACSNFAIKWKDIS